MPTDRELSTNGHPGMLAKRPAEHLQVGSAKVALQDIRDYGNQNHVTADEEGGVDGPLPGEISGPKQYAYHEVDDHNGAVQQEEVPTDAPQEKQPKADDRGGYQPTEHQPAVGARQPAKDDPERRIDEDRDQQDVDHRRHDVAEYDQIVERRSLDAPFHSATLSRPFTPMDRLVFIAAEYRSMTR